ncbi:MAG: DUF1127 domain-containing protein [Sulfitobacter sp.]
MAVNTQTTSADRLYGLGGSFLPLAKFGSTVWAGAKAAVNALQMARMLSTLSNMDDNQLRQIGISRSEIPQYAATLMAKT